MRGRSWAENDVCVKPWPPPTPMSPPPPLPLLEPQHETKPSSNLNVSCMFGLDRDVSVLRFGAGAGSIRRRLGFDQESVWRGSGADSKTHPGRSGVDTRELTPPKVRRAPGQTPRPAPPKLDTDSGPKSGRHFCRSRCPNLRQTRPSSANFCPVSAKVGP